MVIIEFITLHFYRLSSHNKIHNEFEIMFFMSTDIFMRALNNEQIC